MRKAALPFLVLLASPIPAFAANGAVRTPSADSPAGSAISVPPPPEVSDPMLAPVPPPKRIIASWQEAVQLLRARSTDLRTSLDQVLQAEGQTRVALAQYLPTINANGLFTHQLLTNAASGLGALNPIAGGVLIQSQRVPNPNTYGGNIQVSQSIINVQALDQISIDELGEDASRLSVDEEKRTLALSLANQIVAVVTAERESEINRVGLRVALEQAEISSRKRALGAANGLDVVRALQNVANARAALVTGDESLRESREALGLALGIAQETGVSPSVDVSGLAKDAAGSCQMVSSISDRSDVAAARAKLEVAKRGLE
ncbi:MAG: TolC family protein, partial [Polyangiaceae bacterium]